MNEENLPRWDLKRLYRDVEDGQIDKDLAAMEQATSDFVALYKSKLNGDLEASTLEQALAEMQALQKLGLRPYLYAQLNFSTNGTDDQAKGLIAKVREAWSQSSEKLLFFELALLRLEADHFERLVNSKELVDYRHYLENLSEHAPYVLGDEAEQIIKRKDLTGKEAFVQLYEEVTGEMSFSFTMPGEDEPRKVSGEELLALLYHQDAGVREAAFTTFLEGHAEQATVLCACFNNLLLDHGRECSLRGYPDIMIPTHLDHETDAEMVAGLMDVSEENYPLAQEYFALKKKLLGLSTMRNTDLYAPLNTQSRNYSFDEAKQLVLDAFGSFSGEIAEIAGDFFKERRIDVPPATGKSGGAFCQGMIPGEKPYVLVNFTGNLRDVSTLAHELGHGVHFVLSQQQNLYQYQAPLPFAETASVFGEMLLTRHLLEQEGDRETRIALLSTKLEEIIATTFRQNVLTRFELAAHRKRAEGLLSPDAYGELWWQENAKLFGDKVEMIDAYRWGWSYISHFIHARFYCTSYVIGELLVLALYHRYREQGDKFVPLYRELLAKGGSTAPRELLAPFGIDLSAPGFWQQGYVQVKELLDELKQLI
ncbi:MAG: oligoendopeptidase F [Desulfuromonas sp.]|nr:MAG: oligoendopeptidase F [Desulfuromonas sp.]